MSINVQNSTNRVIITPPKAPRRIIISSKGAQGATGAYFRVVDSEADLIPSFGNDRDTAITIIDGHEYIKANGIWAATGRTFWGTLLQDTSAYAISAAASAASAASDQAATAADRTAVADDKIATGIDRTATAADRVQTGLDKAAAAGSASTASTKAGEAAADRVQTGLDRVAAGASATAADTKAEEAAASADTASIAANAAVDAKNAAVSAATSLHNYDTLAQANAELANIPSNAGVNIVADGANNGFYVKQGGVLVKKSDATLSGVAKSLELFKGLDTPEVLAAFSDKNGFVGGRLMSDGAFRTVLFECSPYDWPGITFVDRQGFVLGRLDGSPLSGQGVSPPSIEPYFGSVLAGWQGEPINVHLARLFAGVEDAEKCIVTLLGARGYQSSGDVVVSVLPDKLGSAAELICRPKMWDGSMRAVRPLSVAAATNPPLSATSPVIATFGDSITQASCALLLKDNLEQRGYTPTFVGTRSLAGVASEGRSGWESGDFTFAVTDKVTPVADADFPAYLAMTETRKLDRNPFVRPATVGDAAGDIANGYVLDFARYQSLSGQPAPTIICDGFGTNDVRDRGASVYRTTYEGDLLRYRRMHAAWPNVKVLRWFPVVPRDPARDDLWPLYISMYRGAMDAIRDYGNPKVILVPLWTCASSDGGFHLAPSAPDPTTGVIMTNIEDPLHPTGGTRAEMFRVLSAYVAAAASNLI